MNYNHPLTTIFGLALFAFGSYIIFINLLILFKIIFKHKKATFIPFIGGFSLLISICLIGYSIKLKYFLILFIDYGSS